MQIDRRIRAAEFMQLLSIKRTKFYRMIKTGEIPQPIKVSDREVYWHESSVKKVVEKHKGNSDMIAC
ncbi:MULTISPECIES: helix-turn-helix transcriptional regulator [Acinetobacter]|uniref:helix-turn-helix transcriptional regulator n=1 Tax=Acinetobacter TaxID=469 RepID=UPI001F4BAABE|nr:MULTISPECIES: AlpA family phage regulatory protein [Acinetobacter]MCH7338160.1 AlpA family phage regulatory protein [Acinetobacter higginsii]